jgi:uncharacterized protein (TIGR03083 family)
VNDTDYGALYAEVRRRVTAFVRALSVEDLDRRVPACPEWTVHDVVAHLVGITDDALAGRMDGVRTDPWTAAQVARGRGVPTGELLDRWDANAAAFEARLGPQNAAAIIDITTHEQDLYGAFGIVAARDEPSTLTAMAMTGQPTFEHYRAMMGRRSRAQIDALGIATSVFGPATTDLVE